MLLFLLKLVGILLLIGMVLLALVLFCPFCADVQWEQGVFTVKAGALGLAFPVFQYPKPQPTEPEEPKGPLGKLKAKFRAWRAERKAKKAAAKAEKPAKPKKETSPRKKAKLTLNIICTMLWGAGRLTRAIFGALRFTKIRICLGVRGEDPAQAARTYGKLNAWLYTSLGVLDRFLFRDFEELRLCRISAVRSPPWKTGSRSGYRRGCFSSFVPLCAFFTSSGAKKCWTYSSDLCYNSTVW